LAFLVDQVQQLSCPLLAKAMSKFNTKRAYWQHLRSCFETFARVTWTGLYEAIVAGRTRNQPLSFDSYRESLDLTCPLGSPTLLSGTTFDDAYFGIRPDRQTD